MGTMFCAYLQLLGSFLSGTAMSRIFQLLLQSLDSILRSYTSILLVPEIQAQSVEFSAFTRESLQFIFHFCLLLSRLLQSTLKLQNDLLVLFGALHQRFDSGFQVGVLGKQFSLVPVDLLVNELLQ